MPRAPNGPAGEDTQAAATAAVTLVGWAGNDAIEAGVAVTEDPTLVLDPANLHEVTAEHVKPTAAEAQAVMDHLELRLSELASYVKAEVAKYGGDPHDLASTIADRLREML